MLRSLLSKCVPAFLLLSTTSIIGITLRTDVVSASTGDRPAENFGKPELYFEANHGQTDENIQFIARAPGHQIFLASDSALIKVLSPAESQGSLLTMTFPGASPSPLVPSGEPLPGIVNYLVGNDSSKWRTNIPTYARISQSLYPGIDLVYHSADQQLEFDFVISPGGDPDQITLSITGAVSLDISVQGDLVLQTQESELRLVKPTIYQSVNGEQHFVAGGFVDRGAGQIGFWVDGYDVTQPLIIDPVLLYSTYLGGEEEDAGRAIATDDEGNAYVTGQAHTLGFPTTPGAFQPVSADDFNFDAFVSKFSPDGSNLVFSTFLGGDWWDTGSGIAVDDSGNVYVSGSTDSSDFPTANALQNASTDAWDAFVTKLNPDGSALLFSTYLGGSGDDLGEAGIALDAAGNIYVAGHTRSVDFPTANAFQDSKLGVNAAVVDAYDAFVSKLRNDGSALVYSTYFGGREEDCRWACAIAVDAEGSAYLAGSTRSISPPFLLVNALQPAFGGVRDGFVAKFTPEGDALEYSTYLGGTSSDMADGIVVDVQGSAYVTGQTQSDDFPSTANAFQPAHAGAVDAFAVKLSPEGDMLVYSTFLGGGGQDRGFGIALDAANNAYLTGFTGSDDFPILDSLHDYQGSDAFITILDTEGNDVLFSTYLGGEQTEVGQGITLDSSEAIYVVGYTVSTDFPVLNPFQPNIGGHFDAFVAKFAPFQRAYQYEYAAKIVCGTQAESEDMRLARGFYATTINIHNPLQGDVHLFKKLALTYPPEEEQPGVILPIAEHTLAYDEAMAVDCMDLLDEVFPDGFPTPYIEGFVVIQSEESLDVTAVYTTAVLDRAGRATNHSSIDVERVPERVRNNGADLEVTKTAETLSWPASVNVVQYTVSVTNHGPEAATNVVVTDVVTVDVGTLLDVPPTSFSTTHGAGWMVENETSTSATLTAAIPLLEAGETATLEFAILVMIDVEILEAFILNVATGESDMLDINAANNSDSVETTISVN